MRGVGHVVAGKAMVKTIDARLAGAAGEGARRDEKTAGTTVGLDPKAAGKVPEKGGRLGKGDCDRPRGGFRIIPSPGGKGSKRHSPPGLR